MSVKRMQSDLLVQARPDSVTISIADDHTPPDELSGFYLPRS